MPRRKDDLEKRSYGPIPLKNVTAYRAHSYSCANGKLTERQPHLMYEAREVDVAVDKLKSQRDFELRRWKALEAFYLLELGYRAPKEN